VVLMAGLTALLLALTQGSEGLGWASPVVLVLLASSVLLLVGFVVVERRAPDPVLPLSLFGLRVMSVSSAANFLSGAVLFGVTSYVPLFVQGALGAGAAGAGAALTPMLVTWSISGFVGPRLLLRSGFRAVASGATLLLAVGSAGLLWAAFGGPALVLYVSMGILGFGFGPSTAAFQMVLQEAVEWSQRGVATASMQLFRSLGGTIGVALLGSILHMALSSTIASTGLDASAMGSLLSASGGEADAAEAGLRAALAAALVPVFVVNLVIAAATFVVATVFARDEKLSRGAA
jgi:Na+/melibiose symporter-like transporter